MKTSYCLVLITEKKEVRKEYQRLKWAWKAYRKFTKYANALIVKLEREDGVHKKNIIFYFERDEQKTIQV